MCVFVNALVEICALRTHREFMLEIIQEKTLTECSAERLTLAVCVCGFIKECVSRNVSTHWMFFYKLFCCNSLDIKW